MAHVIKARLRAVGGENLRGTTIEAWDDGLVHAAPLGRAEVGDDGAFEMVVEASAFEHAPRLYFKVMAGDTLVAHSRGRSTHSADHPVQDVPVARGGGHPPVARVFAAKSGRTEGRLQRCANPLAHGTLGDLGRAVRLGDADAAGEYVVTIPIERAQLRGFDASTLRVFRWDERRATLVPVWRSGFNEALGYAWAVVRGPHTLVPLALPRDRILQHALAELAANRKQLDATDERSAHELTRAHLAMFVDAPKELDALRVALVRAEIETGIAEVKPQDVEAGKGGHFGAFPLPGGQSREAFASMLDRLRTHPEGLPEEQLFWPPDDARFDHPPWDMRPGVAWDGLRDRILDRFPYPWPRPWPPWLFSQDWWMYQHDAQHTGHASGSSAIRSTTVGRMREVHTVTVDGPVISKPAIVAGKIYIGSGQQSTGGTLYKIDLATGVVEHTFATAPYGSAFYSWYQGIGGTPCVTGGRVYFTSVQGKVFCLDAGTFALQWVTDVKHHDLAKNQPLDNPVTSPTGDSWTSVLVVGSRVYVGSGEGEANAFGFVFCLDAATGVVQWIFCTNQFVTGVDNSPNVLPRSAVATTTTVPAGFTVHADPPTRGGSVWSSPVHDPVLNRIYVGTGNPIPDGPLPNAKYSSGCVALDAATGTFRGFAQPTTDDSYWPGDSDIDVPGSPTSFTIGSRRVVAIGSKNGSCLVIDADTMAIVEHRQMLPRIGGDGFPGTRGTGIASVVPTGGSGENSWGIMGTPAIIGGDRMFVGIGGYNGLGEHGGAGDPINTPFVRSVYIDNTHRTLSDAWPHAVGTDGVDRYTMATPPLYQNSQVGLSSPAVVNDVVFVSTYRADGPSGLFALSTSTGLCLWAAPALASGVFALGPAISGNYVVLGAGTTVHIYHLPTFIIPWPWPRPWPPYLRWPWPWPPEPPWPWPGPGPDPGPLDGPVVDPITRGR